MPPVQSLPIPPEGGGGGATSDVPKWVWACLIGGGVALMAVGTGYYIFYGGDKPSSPRKVKKSKKREPTEVAKKTEEAAKEVTIEDLPEDEEEKEPTDPLEKAQARKNKGNKYFKGGRYELAIKCYTEAIDICPKENATDLSTFYQNRAAAYDQLDSLESVLNDCSQALELNKKYVKAMDRRAKVLRKQALACTENIEAIAKLKIALEDITAVCILEGFQKQEHLMLVDTTLKDLGRVEASEAAKKKEPVLASKHFIQQYFQSFAEDSIMKSLEQETEGNVEENKVQENGDSVSSGFSNARLCLKSEKYEQIIPLCTEEIDSKGSHSSEAKLLRATFYILSKQQDVAFQDLNEVIEDSEADVKIRVNALIKRASLYIQRCKDPVNDPELSFADFTKAVEIEDTNTDIYHHRGQVHLLIDQVDKAIEDFTKAVELNPGFAIAFVQKLYTDYRKALQSENREAINNCVNAFEQALEKYPKCVETYALFAQVLSDQQQFDRADALYQKAEKIDPENANLLVHRGLIQLQWKGDIEKAVNLIKRGLEKDDKCEFAYETLGTIEVQRGNLISAIQLFEKAIPLANTELEMAHLFGLKNAAQAQTTVAEKLGISLPQMMGMV